MDLGDGLLVDSEGQKRRNRVRIYGDDKYGGRDKKDIKGGEFEE